MMKTALKWILLAALALSWNFNSNKSFGEEFIYKHRLGDKYRILSSVQEDVYVNYKLSHKSEILNRIAVEVTSVTADGRGRHKAVFQTSERSAGFSTAAQKSFQWSREYESEFDRNRLGILSIDPKYYMPVVRNVPVFPGKDLRPGEKWSADGYEMHDFRDTFGIKDPYRIPFTANYEFLGIREWKGTSYPTFSVNYHILLEPQAVAAKLWPRRIIGDSAQIVYWDNEIGQAAAYQEKFRMVFELSDGRAVEYRGSAEAEIVEAPKMDKEKIIEEINEALQSLNITDATVKKVDEGVTISLDNIQFQADSAIMLPGEQQKLDKIAGILGNYKDRDIMVGGHTALAGTAAARMNLSLERAAVVADYLVAKGVRSAARVVVRGFGSDRPVADNTTQEGMRKNRRVEITLLEN